MWASPTADLQKTLAFYESLGFEKASGGSVEGGRAVAFYRLEILTLEIYGNGPAAGDSGAIDPHRPGCVRYRKRPTLWCRGWAIPW